MRRIKQTQRLGSEDGATAVIVAILAVALFGLAALAIDVGALFWERSQLQSGADAGSLAVAQEIARDVTDGGGQPDSELDDDPFWMMAQEYASANAADGSADIEDLSHEALSDPLAGRVIAQTRVNDGSPEQGEGELSHWFAPLLGIDSSIVRARSVAVYGPLTALEGAFPVAVCEQVYEDAELGEVVDIPIKGTGGDPVETACPTTGDFPPGQTPGNFSWLTPDGTGCSVDVVEDEAYGDTGTSIPNECANDARDIEEAIAAHDDDPEHNHLPVRDVVVFKEAVGTGSKTVYMDVFFTGFEFTGIKIVAPEGQNPNIVLEEWMDPICTGPGQGVGEGNGMSGQCVQGSFTKTVATGPVDTEGEGDVLGVELRE